MAQMFSSGALTGLKAPLLSGSGRSGAVSTPVPRNAQRLAPVCVQAPRRKSFESQPFHALGRAPCLKPSGVPQHFAHSKAPLMTRETLLALEAEIENGQGVAALRRFNKALRSLTPFNWEEKLRPVFNEWCYNLESFNPAFTAVLLKVQQSIGKSDYFRRDDALKNLIQPLAGEYGMHNGEPQAKTHRQLFCEFYESLFREPVSNLLDEGVRPIASELMFEQMLRDILGGGECVNPIEQATYALGYNLAIEFMAEREKGWMLESFRDLNERVLANAGIELEWTFMEIHAEDEIEHAAIGHDAVLSFVPEGQVDIARRAMHDHDRDFAVFYNKLASMLE